MPVDVAPGQFQDELCHNFGHFLANELNAAYPDAVVVRSMRTYDAVNLAIMAFPLLKVFRTQDLYKYQTTHRTSSITISYNITFPQVEQLPGLLSFVSEQLNYGVLKYGRTARADFPADMRTPLVVDYRIMQNDIIQQVYPALVTQITLNNCPTS